MNDDTGPTPGFEFTNWFPSFMNGSSSFLTIDLLPVSLLSSIKRTRKGVLIQKKSSVKCVATWKIFQMFQ